MALRVIGAGLGRTGTFSLKFALERLGFGPCHHMAEIWANFSDQLPKWLGVVDGERNWDAVFAGFSSAVDYPACTYWRELAAFYPDAKIILSVRDPDSWFESVSTTVFSEALMGRLAQGPVKRFFDGAVTADFGDRIADRDFMVSYFRRRTAEIKAEISPERLLVFEARQGWEPLCAFLGVPVPEVPYPRTNSREEMLERIAAANSAPGHAPPTPEAMAAMAKAHLEEQRRAAFGAPRPRPA
jgi:hypothetical protein